MRLAAAIAGILGAVMIDSGPARSAPLSWTALNQLPLPPPGAHIAYGPAPQQFGELRMPKGSGPFPVMEIIHGGCWQAEYDYVYMTRLSAWMTERGIATWTIEYRRIGDPGGAWPGTFRDVAAATDALRVIAKTRSLDLGRVYAAGHSAGGQLALWLPTRAALPAESEIGGAKPLPIRGVLGLSAITDLYTYRIGPADSCHASVEALLGGAPEAVALRYAQTSPRQRLPLGVPQVLIQGENDPIVSPESVRAYIDAANAAGDSATLESLPGAGHFEASVPLQPTEKALETALKILGLLGPAPRSSEP